jgi:hypothetical protein
VVTEMWEVEVFIEEEKHRRISTVTVEAGSEAEALRKAKVEISRALAFLQPLAKVTGARVRRGK